VNGTPKDGDVVDPAPPRDAGIDPRAEDPEREAASRRVAANRHWPYWIAVGVLVVGLLVTGAFVFISYRQYTNNERRLLDLRVRELASVLMTSLPNTQTPLASAAALTEATGGNVQKFRRFVSPYVGARPQHQFESVSLWRVGAIGQGPVELVGPRPALIQRPAEAQTFLARASRTAKLSVIGIQPPLLTRLGYALPTMHGSNRFVIYAESLLPSDRRSRLENNTAFSDLYYAIYLGPTVGGSSLLVTNVDRPPIHGRQASTPIPFGNTILTLVVSARQPLSGTLPQRLPWIIAIVGALLSIGAAALTVRLVQRRRSAELLAGRLEHAVGENRRLYAEQRTIAQTLQHALLPEDLPKFPGAEAGARYEPGERGIDVGGDWYDVIPLSEQRMLLVVGDVSGRGLRAATTMASLRYAIHAYAAENDPPATILAKLSKIISVTSSGQIATVLIALVDVAAHEMTIASAGHLPPLIVSNGHGEFVENQVGLPVGVEDEVTYTSVTITAPPAATFLAFTDGLVERRGEALDRGLARLRDAAVIDHSELGELLNRLLTEMRSGPMEDDTAIVGLRWSD
jgi:serine phosphatase RsbU (regulator of sigma subunit)